MNEKAMVTIGIPAYNEEANIGVLVRELLAQDASNYTLQSIIVYSDGCTDSTVDNLRSITDQRVQVIEGRERKGMSYGQMQILRRCDADILILVNADVHPKARNCVTRLIEPILENGADLTSSGVEESPTKSFFGGVITVSNKMKHYLYERYCGGDNVYTCRGVARAISRRLYKHLDFGDLIAEDAYCYFECKKKGMKYVYVKDAVVLYNVPANFKDHCRQSIRFFTGQRKLFDLYGDKFVEDAYKYPLDLAFKAFLVTFLRYPLHIGIYVLVLMYVKLRSLVISSSEGGTWEIAKSTKLLIRKQNG